METFSRAKDTVIPVPDPNDAIGMISLPKVMGDVFGEQWDSASDEPYATDTRCKPSSTDDAKCHDDCSSQGEDPHLETVNTYGLPKISSNTVNSVSGKVGKTEVRFLLVPARQFL